MTRDDILRMAREAGWTIGPATLSGLERFAALVRADEREECAKVCEAQRSMVVARHPARVEFDPNCVMAQKCAAFIRARGEK